MTSQKYIAILLTLVVLFFAGKWSYDSYQKNKELKLQKEEEKRQWLLRLQLEAETNLRDQEHASRMKEHEEK